MNNFDVVFRWNRISLALRAQFKLITIGKIAKTIRSELFNYSSYRKCTHQPLQVSWQLKLHLHDDYIYLFRLPLSGGYFVGCYVCALSNQPTWRITNGDYIELNAPASQILCWPTPRGQPSTPTGRRAGWMADMMCGRRTMLVKRALDAIRQIEHDCGNANNKRTSIWETANSHNASSDANDGMWLLGVIGGKWKLLNDDLVRYNFVWFIYNSEVMFIETKNQIYI